MTTIEVTGPRTVQITIDDLPCPLLVVVYDVWWNGSFAFTDILDGNAVSLYESSPPPWVDELYDQLIQRYGVERKVEDFLLSTDTRIGRMFRSPEPLADDPDTDAKNHRLDAEERSPMRE